MRLLTVDPGESIGYALFVDGVVKASGTENFVHIEGLTMKLLATRPDIVVIERVVPWGLGRISLNITRVMNAIELAFHTHQRLHWMKSAQWKPIMQPLRKEILQPFIDRKDRRFTPHEGDAICIGEYVIRYRPQWLEGMGESATGNHGHGSATVQRMPKGVVPE